MLSTTTLFTGAPHFKSIAKHHRHANYNLEKVLNEAIDNIIKKATKIHIFTEIDSEGRLQELKISDNYEDGFVHINEHGINNPFNMGHIKLGHDDDDETSEFGVGLKAGALSASNYLLVVSKVESHFYEVICDFIKMEKEDDVNASYNPKKREILETDYRDIHPFNQGSSIVLSKILGTICQQTTQHDITQRIKNGISETYSRFLSENMEIKVNGETVERGNDFFFDPKCMPFTVKKTLFILEKPNINDKIYLMLKRVERETWQIYNKLSEKWEVMKDNNFIETKKNEGYLLTCQTRNSLDGSCIKLDTTIVFYSDLIHTKEPFEHLLPQDTVLIYKDQRLYGKKSFDKHNNGAHNHTIHKIEFDSKRIGKELGITFNKEITMDGKNDLILALKSAIRDSRSEFSADTGTDKNKKLCEKAIKFKVIDWKTCEKAKLSTYYRDARLQYEINESKKALPKFEKPKPKPVKKIKDIQFVNSDESSSDYSSSDEPNVVPVINHIVASSSSSSSESEGETNVVRIDPSISVTKDNDTVTDKVTDKVADNITNTITDTIDHNIAKSKEILLRAAELIATKLATNDFDIKLENSTNILNIVQQMLNL